jgi:cytochrome d ubiquinol oxidase subunit I
MMIIAEARWLRSRDESLLVLAKSWAKGTAILFAVGAVSGTVLSFELGLLWPEFMRWAGPIIGMPFSLEGFAFFTEAIFLGIYFYGWDRISSRAHIFAGAMVTVSGAASAIFVVIANAWMNTPTGFRLVNGSAHDVDPIAAMMNPSALPQVIHMLLAAYASVGFAVAGIHAFFLIRDPRNVFHRHALVIALSLGGVAAFLQPLSGDFLARAVAENQPVKLAALEGHFETARGAPLRIGGLPDESARHTPYAIEVPHALSLLAFHDTEAAVQGLNDFDVELWPPVAVVHIAFQVMVGAGVTMMVIALWAAYLRWRRRPLAASRTFLRTLVVASPLGLIALESGWIVTEVGRQPWIIQGVMKTADAVTAMPGLIVPLIVFISIYLFLAIVVGALLLRQFRTSPRFAREEAA